MRFLRKSKKAKKVILVISDIHIGAGPIVDGRKNPLEDFHSDKELVDFFKYYSSGEYQNKEVELIINGDFLDLLAVPFVRYFDDNFWCEEASMKKLELILQGHPEVFEALRNFMTTKNKKIVYIIGNHDAELIFDSLKEKFLEVFNEADRSKVTISNEIQTYQPARGVYLQHGHEYEVAHQFDPKKSIVKTSTGINYFIPSWGSYYVTHVINRYKEERDHVNAVRPIRNFLIHGMIFDTFFTIRFMIANMYYYFMVRFLHYYRLKLGWRKIFGDILSELTLFQDYESLTRTFYQEHPDAKVLIVGHTHEPIFREYSDGSKFINTGTWTRMVNLDLTRNLYDTQLTFAKIRIFDEKYTDENFNENVEVDLYKWAPKTDLPYEDYLY